MELHDRIKEQRKLRGISQETVAQCLGVSRQAVAKWESGQSAPSTGHLLRLAELYGTTVEALVADEAAAPDRSHTGMPLGRRIQWKQMVQRVLIVLAGYAVIYLAGRVFGTTAEQTSVMGWLFGADPQQHTYLYGWLLHQNLFWIAAAISVLAAIVGKIYFSGVSLIGFAVGLLLGEILGPNPAGAVQGHTHYGWAIWAGIYLLFLAAGAVLERMARYGFHYRSRRFAIWMAAVILGTILVILFVRSSF